MKGRKNSKRSQAGESRKTVRVKPRSYQPTKAEKREVVSISATPEQLARSILHPVIVEETDEP